MTIEPDGAHSPPRRRWRLPRVRFSLQTLTLGVLLVSSGYGLWWRWEPWVVSHIIHAVGLSCALFSPDGTKLLTNSRDSILAIWDVSRGELLQKLDMHGKDIGDFVFSSDGACLRFSVNGKYETESFSVWKWAMDSAPTVFPVKSETGEMIAVSADGTRMLQMISQSKRCSLIDTSTRIELASFVANSLICCAEFSDDGRLLAVGSQFCGLVRVFDARTGKALCNFDAGRFCRPTGFSADCSLLLSNSSCKHGWCVVVYDLVSGRLSEFDEQPLPKGYPYTDCNPWSNCSSDNRYLVTQSTQILLWDLRCGKLLQRYADPSCQHYEPFWHPQFSADGSRIVIFPSFTESKQENIDALVMDVSSGKRIGKIGQTNCACWHLSYSPTNDQVATVGNHGAEAVCIWSRRRPEMVVGRGVAARVLADAHLRGCVGVERPA